MLESVSPSIAIVCNKAFGSALTANATPYDDRDDAQRDEDRACNGNREPIIIHATPSIGASWRRETGPSMKCHTRLARDR